MKTASLVLAIFSVAALAFAETNHDWLKHVSEADRSRTNPYHDKADAVAAGSKLYGQHCAKCHGADLQGVRNKPSLRSETVQHATDGELFWLLKNGDLGHGMPSWSSLPEPSRWQIITYVKSTGTAPANAGGNQ